MTRSSPRVLFLFVTAALGCGGRELPRRFGAQSALSAGAREAPVADPTVALTSDPPLPGEAVGAWTGLAPDAGATGGHDHAP